MSENPQGRPSAPVGERLLDTAEVAARLGMSPRAVQLKAQRREIGCQRDGRLLRFRERHIAEYLAATEQPAIPPQVPARPKR